MEDTLGVQEKPLRSSMIELVLILVLMEDTLGAIPGSSNSYVGIVLILVLMEDTLGGNKDLVAELKAFVS